MSSGPFRNVLFVVLAFTAACAAQSQPAVSSASSAARPRIFQAGAQAISVLVSESMTEARLNLRASRPASSQELEGMESALQRFEAAFEDLSLAQVRQVWPNLDRQHEDALKTVFAGFREKNWSRQLRLQCNVPLVGQDVADVQCSEILRYGTKKGKVKEVGPNRIEVSLRQQSGSWLLADMKGTQ